MDPNENIDQNISGNELIDFNFDENALFENVEAIEEEDIQIGNDQNLVIDALAEIDEYLNVDMDNENLPIMQNLDSQQLAANDDELIDAFDERVFDEDFDVASPPQPSPSATGIVSSPNVESSHHSNLDISNIRLPQPQQRIDLDEPNASTSGIQYQSISDRGQPRSVGRPRGSRGTGRAQPTPAQQSQPIADRGQPRKRGRPPGSRATGRSRGSGSGSGRDRLYTMPSPPPSPPHRGSEYTRHPIEYIDIEDIDPNSEPLDFDRQTSPQKRRHSSSSSSVASVSSNDAIFDLKHVPSDVHLIDLPDDFVRPRLLTPSVIDDPEFVTKGTFDFRQRQLELQINERKKKSGGRQTPPDADNELSESSDFRNLLYKKGTLPNHAWTYYPNEYGRTTARGAQPLGWRNLSPRLTGNASLNRKLPSNWERDSHFGYRNRDYMPEANADFLCGSLDEIREQIARRDSGVTDSPHESEAQKQEQWLQRWQQNREQWRLNRQQRQQQQALDANQSMGSYAPRTYTRRTPSPTATSTQSRSVSVSQSDPTVTGSRQQPPLGISRSSQVEQQRQLQEELEREMEALDANQASRTSMESRAPRNYTRQPSSAATSTQSTAAIVSQSYPTASGREQPPQPIQPPQPSQPPSRPVATSGRPRDQPSGRGRAEGRGRGRGRGGDNIDGNEG